VLEAAGEGERVAHGVQQMHPVGRAEGVGAGESLDRRPDGNGPGADDQLVVVEPGKDALFIAELEAPAGGVDRGGGGVQPRAHAGGFQVGVGAVGEPSPVPDLAGDVVRNATDGEVGVGVGDDHGHPRGGVEFTGAQRRADAGVAAADRDYMHEEAFPRGTRG